VVIGIGMFVSGLVAMAGGFAVSEVRRRPATVGVTGE
jgi:hypothetical protein